MSMTIFIHHLLVLRTLFFFFIHIDETWKLIWCRINENDLFKHDWRSRSKTQVLHYIFFKWTLAFLVGLLTGLIATLINLAIENIAGYKLLAIVRLIQKKRFDYIPSDHHFINVETCTHVIVYLFWIWCRFLMGFICFTAANLLLTMVAAVLCVCFAPTAAGPGIPEIKAYLNGVDTPNMFGAAPLIVKVRRLSHIMACIVLMMDCMLK